MIREYPEVQDMSNAIRLPITGAADLMSRDTHCRNGLGIRMVGL